MRKFLPAGFVLAFGFPLVAVADTASDINALRQEIESIRGAYEQRLQALEQRLRAAEARAPAPTADPFATNAPAATGAALAARAGGGANAFNPAISLILSGTYGRSTRDPADYSVTGFALPAGSAKPVTE